MQPTIPLLVVAGEASGDLHAARLLTELRALLPGVRAFGLGGDELRAAGLDALAHSREIAVVGITEVIEVLPRARRIFHRLLAEVRRLDARAAVLVDFPDFNLRLARRLKAQGLTVIYYISPQVWAWRSGRVRSIARAVDRMLVLFPFEVDFYARRGVDVVQVGHPLVDEVPQLPQAWEAGPPAGDAYRIALLPGSRAREVRALLPPMLEAAGRLLRRFPAASVSLILAPTVTRAEVAPHLDRAGVPVAVLAADRFAAIAASHLALCASGTATLEVGLLGTPMVMAYRVDRATFLLARLLVRLPHVALVNLVLDRRAVPELLQGDARGDRLAAEAGAILEDPARAAAMRADLSELRQRLGAPGASRRAAAEVARLLRATGSAVEHGG